jgi:hypothetical protein
MASSGAAEKPFSYYFVNCSSCGHFTRLTMVIGLTVYRAAIRSENCVLWRKYLG